MSIRKNAVAYLALFIALGGTSYAAVAVPAGSVGTRQLRNGAVTEAKLRQHSLTAKAFVPGTLPTLTAASTLKTITVYGPAAPPSCPGNGCTASPAGTEVVLQAAVCPAGYQVLSGGYTIAADETAVADGPTTQGQGWNVTVEFTEPHVYQGMDIVSALCGEDG